MPNYLSAIKIQFLLCGLDVARFTDARLKFYQKVVRRQAPLKIYFYKIIDISILTQIVEQCDYMYMGQLFKALYLLRFYSFLSISNLVPHPLQNCPPPHLPLFQVKNAQNWVHLTDSRVRRYFSLILTRLDMAHSGFTLHTFFR